MADHYRELRRHLDRTDSAVTPECDASMVSRDGQDALRDAEGTSREHDERRRLSRHVLVDRRRDYLDFAERVIGRVSEVIQAAAATSEESEPWPQKA